MPKQRQARKQKNVTKKEDTAGEKVNNVPKKDCPAVPLHVIKFDNDTWITDLKNVFHTEKTLSPSEQKRLLFGVKNVESDGKVKGISLADFLRFKIYQTGVQAFKNHRDFISKEFSYANNHLSSRMIAYDATQDLIKRLINSAINTSQSFFDGEVVNLLKICFSQKLADNFEEFYKNFCEEEDEVKTDEGEKVVKEEVAPEEDHISEGSASEDNSEEERGNAPTISEELRLKLEDMFASLPPQHELVYPPPLPPGTITIPIGGLAKCQCKEGCHFELPEPAYRIPSNEELFEYWRISRGDDSEDIKKEKSVWRKLR